MGKILVKALHSQRFAIFSFLCLFGRHLLSWKAIFVIKNHHVATDQSQRSICSLYLALQHYTRRLPLFSRGILCNIASILCKFYSGGGQYLDNAPGRGHYLDIARHQSNIWLRIITPNTPTLEQVVFSHLHSNVCKMLRTQKTTNDNNA